MESQSIVSLVSVAGSSSGSVTSTSWVMSGSANVSPIQADWFGTIVAILISTACAAGATSDPDGDPVTVQFGWRVGPAMVTGTGDTLSGQFSRGDMVRCELTPNDGSEDWARVTAAPRLGVNDAATLDRHAVVHRFVHRLYFHHFGLVAHDIGGRRK